MIIGHVSVREDISTENKKKTVNGITKVFEDLGVPRKQSRSSFMKRQSAIVQRVENCIQKDMSSRRRLQLGGRARARYKSERVSFSRL